MLELEAQTTPNGGWRYMLPVSIGTPPQLVSLLFDTGSHLLLVRNAGAGACGASDPPVRGACFNASASTSLIEPPNAGTGFRDTYTFSYVVDVDVDLTGKYSAAVDDVRLPPSPPWVPAPSVPPPPSALSLMRAASAGGIGPLSSLPHFWADAAGVLGSSHQVGSPWESLLAAHGSAFSLDLNRQGRSYINLGRLNRTVSAGRIQWSGVQPDPNFHRFEMYDPRVCGASLLGATSAFWPGLIDTGASCISMPADLFDSLTAWVSALECTAPAAASAAGGVAATTARRCRLPPGISASALPVLTFRMSQQGSELQLPLEELLLPPDANGYRELCIRSRAEIAAHSTPQRGVLLIGTAALHYFVTHYDMMPGMRRLGFAPKAPPLDAAEIRARRASCAPRAQCVGQEAYSASHNRCVPPKCSAFFQRLEGGVCGYPPAFITMALVVVGLMSAAEYGMHEVHERLPRRLAESAPAEVANS